LLRNSPVLSGQSFPGSEKNFSRLFDLQEGMTNRFDEGRFPRPNSSSPLKNPFPLLSFRSFVPIWNRHLHRKPGGLPDHLTLKGKMRLGSAFNTDILTSSTSYRSFPSFRVFENGSSSLRVGFKNPLWLSSEGHGLGIGRPEKILLYDDDKGQAMASSCGIQGIPSFFWAKKLQEELKIKLSTPQSPP